MLIGTGEHTKVLYKMIFVVDCVLLGVQQHKLTLAEAAFLPEIFVSVHHIRDGKRPHESSVDIVHEQ